ncbi:short-chain dehydrogenase/reductase SDR [Halothece sp. PCC 7418]|uniref:SDR family NAD(P)-dependent oxidoreductase n=1 Tax=Halothece sp. (strain PCC 7418) TaxID=65093 RepID=UPI0002A06581|nr:short-chain dehydrogenase/reductase SDR [Halothece sp. PCC 7418]
MKTALVTGASSGIGYAFAQTLAERGYNLVLVARSQDKLEQLANNLQSSHNITTEVIPQDLTATNAAQNLFNIVTSKEMNIDLLINNAGFGDYGVFADSSLDKQLEMIQLNITSLTALTHLFLSPMREKGTGGIINISSIAGFQPLPYMSIYAATKAFVLSFSEAIWAENRDAGITVTCVCPGPTETEFFKVANFPDSAVASAQQNYTSPEAVVKAALEAFDKQQANVVTGGLPNQLIVNIPRFLPRETLVSAVAQQFRPHQ